MEEDILYGKRRHLFGGVEPSNMKKFSVAIVDGKIEIEALLPDDTVIEGQTLCTVAGAVIRYKENEYPKDEFDGVLIHDIKADSTIVLDDDLFPDGCYFAAFPYTTQGVYNRNPINRATLNVVGPVTKFTGRNIYDYTNRTSTVELAVELPEGAAGAIIRKSPHKYPISETDGEEFLTITEDGIYTDSDVGITTGYPIYYYSIFPYGENGAYNYDISKSIAVKCTKYNYLFGFDIDTTDPNPETRVTYPEDVDNTNYKPVFMDYDIDKFNYGDWNIAPGEKFMPRPCMLRYDGTVAHYLDPNDYSKRDDGVIDSKVSDFAFEGNAMMEWPKIFTKRWEENGIYHFRCSDQPQDADWDCWCNYDIYDNQIDHFYTSIYTTSYDETITTGTKLRSISGRNIQSYEYFTEYRSWGRYYVNGSAKYDNWDIGLIADHLLIQDLLVMMGKSTDCQTIFGNGTYSTSSYRHSNTGTMDDKGLFWGKNDAKSGVKVFGMEDYWGNDRRFLAGWNLYSGIQYVKITKGAHDGVKSSDNDSVSTKYDLFNPANRSKQIKLTTAAFSTGTLYCASMLTKPYGRFPTSAITTGSSTTYEADQITWSNTSENTVNTVGGPCDAVEGANGPFAVRSQSSSSGYPYTTTTLSCKPVKQA